MPLFSPVTAGLGIYGDGSDGVVTFDGVATVLGLVPAANVYTLARDLFLRDGSAINAGVAIVTNGFRLFCSGTLTNNGTIRWNGAAGTLGGAGAAQTVNGNGTVGTTAAIGGGGGNGNPTVGANGAALTRTQGGSGGNGGAGGTGAAGTGGVAAPPAQVAGTLRFMPLSVLGQLVQGNNSFVQTAGGQGAGGGGGDGTNSGGGGGAGGGIVLVAARYLAGTGAIQARGGTGGAGAATGNTGGGGGGGGGLVLVTSGSVVIGSPNSIAGQSIDANGGALGAHFGTGADGVAGSSGTVILVPN